MHNFIDKNIFKITFKKQAKMFYLKRVTDTNAF